ncbi:MAG: hypothetical protein U0Q15_02575 [Kineosporiaceae bacterium]
MTAPLPTHRPVAPTAPPALRAAADPGTPVEASPQARRRLTREALLDLLAVAWSDDASRPRADAPAWRVLCLRSQGASGLYDLVATPRHARWLRPGRAPVRLAHRDPAASAPALVLPDGLDGYAAAVLVEPGGDAWSARRLQEAGHACWRAATAAGFDAVLITATPSTPVTGGPRDGAPVVAVGICRAGLAPADHAFRTGRR